MTIRVLFYEPYPMGLGGNFLTQRLILERLDRGQFEPVVAAPRDGQALERFRALGIECIVLPPPGDIGGYGGSVLRLGPLGRVKAAADLLSYNLTVAGLLRERKIDVVYANCVRAQMSVGLGARLAGVPSLLYVKGVLANPVIDHISFALAGRILFFCEQNRDDKYPRLVRWCREKIDVLRIGMDPKLISAVESRDRTALRKELGIDASHVNVAVLAQLYRPKGQHFVIEALSRLAKDIPNIRLYLVGDHVIEEYRPYREELEKLIAKHGLTDRVTFTGWRLDALDIASLMDIIIHPTLAEGFGRAVLESMALGKPVIASAIGGLREAIRDGENGYLVPIGDVTAIADRWRALASDPELRARIGQAARETVYRDYLIDDKVARLAEIWAEMAGRGN